jgi:hypothetical protein
MAVNVEMLCFVNVARLLYLPRVLTGALLLEPVSLHLLAD